MAEESFQEKTEQPSSKKISDARKKGQVVKSREIPSVLILLVSLAVFYLIGSSMFMNISEFMRYLFLNISRDEFQNASLYSYCLTIAIKFTKIVFPLMAAVFVAGILSHVVQFGFLFSSEALTPKLSKIDPLKGMKRIISLKALIELLKSLLKILVVGSIAYIILLNESENFMSLVEMSIENIFSFMGLISFKMSIYICAVLIVLAALDFIFQRWQHEKDLRMTKQEVKEENKQREGDPIVKSRIRQVQMEMAQRRMMDDVPKADVVITNPTRLAIAIKYDANKMIAPKVLAKGSGFIAQKIREIAIEKGIPLVEQKPLAQALYKTVEIGDIIPSNLYKAVAEILAYVYRLKKKK
jgi:flagellar biosynthetic protein FlhB